MSMLLLLCVVGAAVWVAVSFASRSQTGPKDSVEDFSRALSALSPQARPTRRPAGRRPAPRPAAGRPAPRRSGAGRPVARSTSAPRAAARR